MPSLGAHSPSWPTGQIVIYVVASLTLSHRYRSRQAAGIFFNINTALGNLSTYDGCILTLITNVRFL
jgi:hypothetical protein